MMAKIRKYGRYISALFLLNFLFSLFSPSMTYALTAGPSSPEFSNFEPVTTTDMVNLFSGDMVYNLPVIEIPGPDGAGYALSLSYHSGSSSESEASWVGHGWTLNPGAINRSVNGYPDDYNGADVEVYNKTRPNWTISSQTSLSWEVYSQNINGINASMSNRFNNYMGFSNTIGLGISAMGMSNLGISFNGVETNVNASVSINPIGMLKRSIAKHREKVLVKEVAQLISSGNYANMGQVINSAIKNNKTAKFSNSVNNYSTSFGTYSFAHTTQPLTNNQYKGISLNFGASIIPTVGPMTGLQVGIEGGFNIQSNIPEKAMNAYGYMYTPPNSDDNKLEDFAMEKQSQYNKRNRYIGIPYNTADNFVLTGEGLGGGFRAFRSDVGHYQANTSLSETTVLRGGIELQIGVSIGVGLNIGGGKGKFEVKNKWHDGAWVNNNDALYKFGDSRQTIMRFTNDMGGKIDYSVGTQAECATINDAGNYPELNGGIGLNMNEFKHVSSNISTNTESQYSSNKFNKNVNTDLIFTGHNNPDAMREISILKEDGSKYVYGLPVYTKNQVDISVGRKNSTLHNNSLLEQQNVNEKDDILSNRTVVGTKKTVPYANTYLLTQITGSNYYDRNNDGPDDLDYGAWTKFNYRKKYGSGGTNDWYNYRTPYSGLSYNVNNLSDKDDDMGFLSRGEKEVYYAKSVETKTHVAFFITNKTVPSDFESKFNDIPDEYLTGTGLRYDGFSTAENASESLANRGTQDLEKLEKIVLFSKNRLVKPIKIVNFSYDYSLIKNTPNNNKANWPSEQTSINDYNISGKLTLKKVWFEYEGVSNTKISPYEFGYDYFTDYSNEILEKYSDLTKYNSLAKEVQNPDYQAELLDPWGNIQYNAIVRAKQYKSWPYQGKITDNEFDPAAWQLKRITLPSGGQIHIQYEQKDYQYVQDRKAMSLVTLKSVNEDNSQEISYYNNTYELNLTDIGIVPAAYSKDADYVKDVNSIVSWLNTLKSNAGSDYNMLFFKFLYGLKSGTVGSLENGESEFISGYTAVSWVEAKRESDNGPFKIKLKIGNHSDKDHPQDFACAEILTNNKAVRPTISGLFESFDNKIQENILELDQSLEWNAVKGLLFAGNATGLFSVLGSVQPIVQGIKPGTIDPLNSYFKILNPRAKRGGGVRVKRLLMYDEGFNGQSGTESIYGNEYYYELADGSSSGVATNEPVGMREENALVGYLHREERSAFGNLFYGRDRTEEEGPIGENVLPSPSIGHSRVVVENIHKGNTGTGHIVYDYFTAKDYPFDKEYNNVNSEISGQGFKSTDLNQDQDNIALPLGIFNYSKKHDFATQGFRFIINNMHGQQKKISSFGGSYHSDIKYTTGSEEFEYYEPGEKMPILEFDSNGSSYRIVPSNPGKEMDIAMNMNTVKDFNWNLSIEVDLAAVVVCPLLGIGLSVSIENSAINTHAISKVISYPVILKKKTSMQDNIKHVVENVYFDKYTGQAVVTKSYDEYDGLTLAGNTTKHNGAYYSTDLKASWFYPSMGPVWGAAANTNELTQSVGSIVTYQDNPFFAGDTGNDVDKLTFNKVISAGLQTYHKPTAAMVISPDGLYLPNYLLPWSSYTFKTEAVTGDNTFNKGWANSSLNLNFANNTSSSYFNWTTLTQPSPWLRSTSVELYSTAGLPLMERNAMDIYSCAKYGYNNQLPVLVAQNAKYHSVYFFDFEENNDYSASIRTLLDKDFQNSHSGYQSVKSKNLDISGLNIDMSGATQKKLSVKFWLKSVSDAQATVNVASTNIDANLISKSGEWALYEAIINATSTINSLSINVTDLGNEVWLDDIRIQPLDSEMKAFVYDKATYRLLAEFDNQHFGLFYQYNDEGKLVRKMIETERGRYTVQEKQYNMKSKNK